MAALTDTAETRVLNWIRDSTTSVPPVYPLKVALTSTVPTDSTAGTELTGGSYARQNLTLGTPSGTTPTEMTNSALVRFNNLAAGTCAGVEIWDSAGTPVRWFHDTLRDASGNVVSRTLVAGDVIEFAVGLLRMRAA